MTTEEQVRARPEDMARARMWQVLTTDLRDIFGTRPDEDGLMSSPRPAPVHRITCTTCDGTGVVLQA